MFQPVHQRQVVGQAAHRSWPRVWVLIKPGKRPSRHQDFFSPPASGIVLFLPTPMMEFRQCQGGLIDVQPVVMLTWKPF
jgi:hypothetical protein